MVLLLTKRHANDDDDDDNNNNNETKRLNSSAIDANAYSSVLNSNQLNCQLVNDVENIGLQCNNKCNNGQTISINFKQTKMQVRQHNINLEERSDQCIATELFHKEHRYRRRFNASQYTNKMQLFVLLVVYLVTFNGQLAVARPNVDRNYNSDTNSQNVDLTSEDIVSKSNSNMNFIMNHLLRTLNDA